MNEKEKIEQAVKDNDYRTLYDIFERKYNPYPVQMGRYDAFGRALRDGLITKETYDAAAKYYGNLWHYVGD